MTRREEERKKIESVNWWWEEKRKIGVEEKKEGADKQSEEHVSDCITMTVEKTKCLPVCESDLRKVKSNLIQKKQKTKPKTCRNFLQREAFIK